MTWPVLTGSPGFELMLWTMPSRCALTSFSIFIASMMQSTWPVLTTSPSATLTASIVPCIGLVTASVPAPRPPPLSSRSRRRWPSATKSAMGSCTFTSKRRPFSSTLTERSRSPAAPAPAPAPPPVPAAAGYSSTLSSSACSASSSDSTMPWHVPPSMNAWWRSKARWKPSRLLTPPTSNSSRARSMRRRAVSRLVSWTISLAIIGS